MESEVKGAWFATARRFLIEGNDPGALEQVLNAMAPQHRGVLADPIGSAWYPEAALQEMLSALYETVADGDLHRFEDIMRRSTHVGVGRFFRMMISLGSFTFVIRNIPTMWKRLRRGPGRVEVDFSEDKRGATVHYREFPYFGDPLYRAMTVGSLRGMVEVAVGDKIEVRALDHGDEYFSVSVMRRD